MGRGEAAGAVRMDGSGEAAGAVREHGSGEAHKSRTGVSGEAASSSELEDTSSSELKPLGPSK